MSISAAIKVNAARVSQAHQSAKEEISSHEDFMKSWRDFPISMKCLLTNPVFIFATLGATSEGLLLFSFAAFLPKIIENQFAVTTNWAAMLAGKRFSVSDISIRAMFLK